MHSYKFFFLKTLLIFLLLFFVLQIRRVILWWGIEEPSPSAGTCPTSSSGSSTESSSTARSDSARRSSRWLNGTIICHGALCSEGLFSSFYSHFSRAKAFFWFLHETHIRYANILAYVLNSLNPFKNPSTQSLKFSCSHVLMFSCPHPCRCTCLCLFYVSWSLSLSLD